jgi:mannitol/fructose-specific phosphotransferase system IIA component (Ntr-type)
MGIENILTESLISDDLKGSDKYSVIESLLDLLWRDKKLEDRETCLRDLVERETYLSTGLENGLAVPHAKTAAVKDLLVSFGVCPGGLDFGTLDGKPAHFVFLVVSPLDTSGPHIKMLAQITRNFREQGVGEKILSAKSKKEILEIIQNFK